MYILHVFRKRKCFVGDFKDIAEIDSPNSRLKYWIATKKEHENHIKKIKSLRKENYRLEHKIKTMNNLITHLKDEKRLISDNCFSVLKVRLFFNIIFYTVLWCMLKIILKFFFFRLVEKQPVFI